MYRVKKQSRHLHGALSTKVTEVIGKTLLEIMDKTDGGIHGAHHSWVSPVAPSTSSNYRVGPSSLGSCAPNVRSTLTFYALSTYAYIRSWQYVNQAANVDVHVGPASFLDKADVRTQVIELLRGYLEEEVDIAKPLAMQGIDSLASMELRQKLQVRGHSRQFLCKKSIIYCE